MSGRIALEELDTQLSRARTRYDKWSSAKTSAAGSLKAQHTNAIEEKRERLAALKQEESQISQSVEAIKSRRAQEAEVESALQREVESLKVSTDLDQAELNKLQQAVEAAEEHLCASQQEAEAERRLVEGKLASLQARLHLYEERLGLRFLVSEDISGELLVVFSNVDPADHVREFSVGVRVQPEGSYEVTTCKPALDSLEQLQSELQESKNFGAFVQDARRHFCRLCQ